MIDKKIKVVNTITGFIPSLEKKKTAEASLTPSPLMLIGINEIILKIAFMETTEKRLIF